jgi:hypothetical protein
MRIPVEIKLMLRMSVSTTPTAAGFPSIQDAKGVSTKVLTLAPIT